MFARVTGDNNPIHTNAEFAASTMFKLSIMYGMLGSALFSKIFRTLFPGVGTIYLSQTLNFLKPMYAGKEYEEVFTVLEIFTEKTGQLSKQKLLTQKRER